MSEIKQGDHVRTITGDVGRVKCIDHAAVRPYAYVDFGRDHSAIFNPGCIPLDLLELVSDDESAVRGIC